MDGASLAQGTAQLDKAEREHLENIVTEMRERVEDNVEFQLRQRGLNKQPDESASVDEDTQQLVEAIELEAVDGHSWRGAFEEYVTGVGYTILNRLAALRCMEVRDFIAAEVTVFKDNGLTPAAETLVNEEFLMEDEAILEAYHNACDDLAEEIEILFDRSTPYSLVDPDDDTFEELCGMLDEIPDEVWRADDVLGWVYEYYNRPVVEALDAKNTLEPEDVGPANQFYTPHWVVRMLTDNSLGKLYLEATGQESTVPDPEALSPEERKERLVTPEDAPSVAELCTYLIPDEEAGEAPEFDHPKELRIIDPACGSGHFLLYAFDVLERIWWAETDLDRAEIPAKVLEHNLYGVDIDLRSCQLSAFNLYLKARTRTEAEDGRFEMPNVGVVCADSRVAEVEEAAAVLDEITGEGTDLRDALNDVIAEFQQTEALGSLLDVSGTLTEVFDAGEVQSELGDWQDDTHNSLNAFLRALRAAVEERTSNSFGEQNLKSFLHLLVVLTQEYDVSLMNPPYGSRGRMPKNVRDYVGENYEYTPEYYINFFEACNTLVAAEGRIGMLVPWSFLFNQTYEPFRSHFVGERGSFDFLSEFGYGVLDNATVGTVGTVVRNRTQESTDGTFIRLHDKETSKKEITYLQTAFGSLSSDIKRYFRVALEEFSAIPGTPICYSLPQEVRKLHDTVLKMDPDVPGIEGEGVSKVKQGLATADNGRFLRKHWEGLSSEFKPFTNAGGAVWVLPQVDEVIDWSESGSRVDRAPNSVLRNMRHQTQEGLTWAYIKRTGRRFGHYPKGGYFGHASNMLFPEEGLSAWQVLGAMNSDIYHSLALCLTPERKWESGYIGMLPWFRALENRSEIGEKAKEQHLLFIQQRVHDFKSPYYIGPKLLPQSSASEFFYSSHEHVESLSKGAGELFNTGNIGDSLVELCRKAKKRDRVRKEEIEMLARKINQTVSDALDISNRTQELIKQEIWLRTVESPEDRKVQTPDEVPDVPDDFPGMVKNLMLHFALRTVAESDDGVVPLSTVEDEPDLLDRIEGEFERVFGEHATDRLAEADAVLGAESADEEAYPNLRTWLEDDMFDYHVSMFDRTPILWRLTTERLVSDPDSEGFACLVDYHEIDEGLFDILQNRYLEPRKSLLRERRSAANRRHGDDALPSSEQAAAADQYARCESGLEQITVFEDRLSELAESSPRDWSNENQRTVAEAAERVVEFRERTEERLAAVDELAGLDDADMAALFTENFYEKVEDQREEWLDALDDLENAFRAYADDADDPVPAHLYDLFDYYADDLLGSSHFASNGILYMTYYFDDFEQADQGRLDDASISRRQRLISQLAGDLNEYIELGETIAEDCQSVSSNLSSEWEDRALSEITTAGYQPNHKHGVEINITPLVEAEIVPTTVDDQVI